MIPIYSPLEAYRRDLARIAPAPAFGAEDREWIAASLALQRYVEADARDRAPLAQELARHLAVGNETSVCDAALRVATEIEHVGALHLAATWLALLEQLLPRERVRDHGRVLCGRARIVRKFGDMEEARALYHDVERLGEAHGDPELTARAWVGHGVLAQMRGNYPEARRWFTSAALVADDNGCTEAAYYAHHSLCVCAAIGGDLSLALREGWQAYQLAGTDSEHRAEALGNLSQVLYDAGEYRAARRGFATVLATSRYPSCLLPALGGAAMTAARVGDASGVDAAAQRIASIGGAAWTYAVSSALIDLGEAYELLGRREDAAASRARALELAHANQYHELTHRALHPKTVSPTATLSTEAIRVARDVERMNVPRPLAASLSSSPGR